MRVLLEDGHDGVPDNEDGKNTCQNGLNNHQDKTHDCLSRLFDAELVHKDENADDGQQTDNLDGDVENVAGLALKGPVPDEEAQHEGLDDELRNGLGHAVRVADSHDDALGKHVADDGDEQPPVGLFVVVVEELVLDPEVLVLVQLAGIAVELLQLLGRADDHVCKEGEHAREQGKGKAGEQFGGPRVTRDELVHAVQDPGAVEQHDELREQSAHGHPVMLAETGQARGQLAEQRPGLEDDLDEQNDADDGGHDTGHDQEHRHERVGVRNAQLLHVGLDALHGLRYTAGAASGTIAAARAVGGSISVVCVDGRGNLSGNKIVKFGHGALSLGVAELFNGAIRED